VEKNGGNNFLFGAQGGQGNYCDAQTMSDYKCEVASSFPCVILRDVMHDGGTFKIKGPYQEPFLRHVKSLKTSFLGF